jgi:biogenesis of lysosome-related organelles complex 1 subunit 2
MKELEEIETTVNKLEAAAYRLDSYSLRLEEKINEYIAQKPSA